MISKRSFDIILSFKVFAKSERECRVWCYSSIWIEECVCLKVTINININLDMMCVPKRTPEHSHISKYNVYNKYNKYIQVSEFTSRMTV